jgi:hypothetical protein
MVDFVADAAPPLPTSDLHSRQFEVPMAVTDNGSRRVPNWERVRENGKFVRDPTKTMEAEPHPTRHTAAYRKLRNMALRLMDHLEEMLPPLDMTPDGPPEPAEGRAEAENLHPAYERLLGRSDGVIDGFNTLTLLVIRLSDKERESRGQAKRANIEPPKIDEDELDRRILAELDFLARQKSAARPD